MPLEVMEHVNIRAADMEATKEFYCDVPVSYTHLRAHET